MASGPLDAFHPARSAQRIHVISMEALGAYRGEDSRFLLLSNGGFYVFGCHRTFLREVCACYQKSIGIVLTTHSVGNSYAEP